MFARSDTCWSSMVLTDINNSHVRIFKLYPEKILTVTRTSIFEKKKYFAIFWSKSRFQMFFFCAPETCFSTLAPSTLKNSSLRHTSIVPIKKITSGGAGKQLNLFFFIQIEISNVIFFCIFWYFTDLFFNSEYVQLQELSFFAQFSCSQKTYLLWHEHVFFLF